jgi:hypothetical protein
MGVESPSPDGSRDKIGRLTNKDTAQTAAEAVDQLQINAQRQGDEHISDQREAQKERIASGERTLRDEHFERYLAEDTERVRKIQTSEDRVNALDKATTDDLISGSANIKESGRESARVEEIRTRGPIENIRAKLFGEKPLDK